MTDFKDCRLCKFSTTGFHGLLCTVTKGRPIQVEHMRDDRSECGMVGWLWEPKEPAK